ncbi:hypothetical protein ACFYO5_05395 [Streptomyces sp. NPDC006259]|uniref:hypothetical protein n=1 Tax=Streptomyces sp. NPDC006259 TaxID=3364740 RepID=UPI003692EC0C
MGQLKVTLCAGFAAVAATLTPTAYAANPAGGVAVIPAAPAPGHEVALEATGCSGRKATAESHAFVSPAHLVGSGGSLSGETRVRTSIGPGSYEVTVTCADLEIRGAVEVVAASARPSTPESPVAPVMAGGGGAAPLPAADESRVAGPGLAHAVTGLLLAGVAAVAVVLRGTRRRRGTE